MSCLFFCFFCFLLLVAIYANRDVYITFYCNNNCNRRLNRLPKVSKIWTKYCQFGVGVKKRQVLCVADPLTAGSGNASTGKRRGVFPSRLCNDSRTRLTSSDVTRHYACHNHDLTNKNIDSSSRERRTRIIDELRGQLDCRNCHGNRTDAEAESNECLLISRTMPRRSKEAASSTIEPQNAGQRDGEREGEGYGRGWQRAYVSVLCL